jgi:hypothetical protein
MSVDTRLLFELGLRLIPVIARAGLAICGIGAPGVPGAPAALKLWPSLMAFCPATHALSGVLALMCSILQTVVHRADSSSLIAWTARAVVFAVPAMGSNGGASSLADCSVSEVCSCAVAFLVSCLHSAVLQHVLGVVLPM